MSLDARDRLVEAQIRAAQERGDFDGLPGEGEPLNLDDLSGLTPEQRFQALLFRTLGEVTPEVALLREIRTRREALAKCGDDAERERLRGELLARAAELSAMVRGQK